MAKYLSTGLLLFLGALWAASTFAQPNIAVESWVTGLTRPVGITHAGDDRLFVLEQAGRIRIIEANGTLLGTSFLDIRAQVRDNGSEEGLLGLAFHPDYTSNGLFFVNYTTGSAATRRTVVARFQRDNADPNLADPSSEQILLQVPQPYSNHNGGDLHFGPDGYLYISLGDGGDGGDPLDSGQDSLSLLGKILRIDVDQGSTYGIPADNPFVQDPGIQNEIWSFGWRNPWRFSFDRQTGDMWIGDVGQGAREEISFEPMGTGGRNYGWRCKEGNNNYNLTDCLDESFFTPPVLDYPRDQGKSVTGGYVYRGQLFPALAGHYVFGDYVSGNFWTIYPDGNDWDTTFQGNLLTKVSAFGENAAGELFVAKLDPGRIYRVIETAVGTSLETEWSTGALEVFPHPVKSGATLTYPNPGGLKVSVKLYSLSGQLLWEAQSQEEQLWLPRESRPAGTYLLQAQLADGPLFHKKIVLTD